MAKDTSTTDFSARGRRIRIVLSVYEREKRNFRPEEKALLTVASAVDQKRLWRRILKCIEEELGGT